MGALAACADEDEKLELMSCAIRPATMSESDWDALAGTVIPSALAVLKLADARRGMRDPRGAAVIRLHAAEARPPAGLMPLPAITDIVAELKERPRDDKRPNMKTT